MGKNYDTYNASPLNFNLPEMGTGLSRAFRDAMRNFDPKKDKMPKMCYKRMPRAVEILSDGGVQFNVYEPDAKTVEVAGLQGSTWGDKRHVLEDVGDGWFSLTLYDMPPGFQYLNYYIDGVEMLYKRAPFCYGFLGAMNFVDVPDPELDFYDYKDVPHGAVRHEYYYSSYTGKVRNCWVYTPPSYDESPDKHYPVWYVQHGGGENETGWFWEGRLNFILDNLIAEGKCKEMIVVTNAGYAFSPDSDEEDFLPGDLGEVLRKDCIPFIEKRFRAIPEKCARAMSGLSMGSFQTQWECYNHPETFDYVGVFSGACLDNRFKNPYETSGFLTAENAQKLNSEHKLLFFARGMEEGGEMLYEEYEELKKRGIEAEIYTCPGVHEWQVWRKTAREFAQKLFTDL